ncbi:MAG TPA: alpha/beta fold hydrolase [Anaerolineales bacterium]|nr:alpha/beta fold hydrolase [Anaerolineales bacterium]
MPGFEHLPGFVLVPMPASAYNGGCRVLRGSRRGEMPNVHVRGTRVFYAVSRGEGPAVVLIHGAGGSRLHWPASLRRLSDACVYALDLPGHGRSGGRGRERIEDYAGDVVGFLDAVGVERAVLVGHSMGGGVAQAVALTAPGRVSALVLLSTGARLRVAPAVLEGLGRDFAGTIRQVAEWAWGPGADPALVAEGRRLMEEAGPRVLLGDFLACDRFDVRDRVGKIAAPTLVVTGSEDQMTPPRFGRWLADRIPDARFSLVEGAGHMLALERPAEVAAMVEGWLSAVHQGTSRKASSRPKPAGGSR